MKRAVVTGANGFVGRAIVKELLKQGVEVIAIVHNDSSYLEEFKVSKIFFSDISDYSSIGEKIRKCQPDVFYHLAWTGSAGALRCDEKIQLANVQGTCDAVRLAANSGCKKFIFASSIMEYEVAEEIKKSKIPAPNSIYSTAKITANYMGRIIAGEKNIEYISAVISNIYGPGEKSPRLINSSIRKLLNNERVSLSPCNQLYDFIFVTDAAKMFVALGSDGKNGNTYYIGNNNPKPLRNYMEELRDVVSPDSVLGFGDLPFNGVSLSYDEIDTQLVYRDMGIEPEISFADGIEITMDYIKKEGRHE